MTELVPQRIAAFRQTVARRYESPLYFPRVFGPRQCDRIIALGCSLPRDEALVSGADLGRRSDHREPETRSAGVSWITPAGEALWIFEKMGSIVERANKLYQYDLLGFTEDAQFTSYDDTGDFYDWHQDGLEGELAIRKLSVVIALSDPDEYTGADLEMFGLNCDEEIAASWRQDLRRRGSAVVFPSFEYHRVTRLLSGQRYSLVCWVGGPPFR